MGKKYQNLVYAFAAVFMAASVFALTGCGSAEHTDSQADIEEMSVDLEVQQEMPIAGTDDDTVKIQEAGPEQGDAAELNVNRKTAAEYEAEDRARRAALEERVKEVDGISEEKAIEIAEKALETDLGEKGKELELSIDETYGWRSDLCVADWSEIKAEDKGAIAYSVGFNNAKEGMDVNDLVNYCCVVNAADGSILEAYTVMGWDNTVYYEHE